LTKKGWFVSKGTNKKGGKGRTVLITPERGGGKLPIQSVRRKYLVSARDQEEGGLRTNFPLVSNKFSGSNQRKVPGGGPFKSKENQNRKKEGEGNWL